ncbi:hypothetical protein, partial [Leptospira selangorensis]|uniref:hypothetical protein n=1 Tax=Leptospira selangorensis TaxID=2484982 RepID=UPI001AEF8C24
QATCQSLTSRFRDSGSGNFGKSSSLAAMALNLMEILIEIFAYIIGVLKWIFTGMKGSIKDQLTDEKLNIFMILLLTTIILMIFIGYYLLAYEFIK